MLDVFIRAIPDFLKFVVMDIKIDGQVPVVLYPSVKAVFEVDSIRSRSSGIPWHHGGTGTVRPALLPRSYILSLRRMRYGSWLSPLKNTKRHPVPGIGTDVVISMFSYYQIFG